MKIQKAITEKLNREFSPEHLEVINESDQHNVPAGSESHFKIVLVSNAFEDTKLITRHRLVNKVLTEELKNDIHALALHTMTMKEWYEKGNAPDSPPCLGGDGKNT